MECLLGCQRSASLEIIQTYVSSDDRIKVYINDKGLIKLEIILAKGKSNIDKRHSLKEKDLKLDIQRSLKDY